MNQTALQYLPEFGDLPTPQTLVVAKEDYAPSLRTYDGILWYVHHVMKVQPVQKVNRKGAIKTVKAGYWTTGRAKTWRTVQGSRRTPWGFIIRSVNENPKRFSIGFADADGAVKRNELHDYRRKLTAHLRQVLRGVGLLVDVCPCSEDSIGFLTIYIPRTYNGITYTGSEGTTRVVDGKSIRLNIALKDDEGNATAYSYGGYVIDRIRRKKAWITKKVRQRQKNGKKRTEVFDYYVVGEKFISAIDAARFIDWLLKE